MKNKMTKLILHIKLKITYRLYICIDAIQQRLFNKFERLYEQLKGI